MSRVIESRISRPHAASIAVTSMATIVLIPLVLVLGISGCSLLPFPCRAR